MLEVTFNDSAAGSMIMACGLYQGFGTPIALTLNMDMGDLHYGALSEYRLRQINAWFKDDPWLDDVLFKVKDMVRQKEALSDVICAADNGEKIRIWYDYMSHSICGLYHLISEIGHMNTEISVVCVNEHPTLSLQCRGMGSLNYRDYRELLSVERKLSKEERDFIKEKWQTLEKQEYPLRVFLNGSVVGVPEYFYDSLFSNYIPHTGEFRIREIEARIMALDAAPYLHIVEWRLSSILQSMNVKRRKLDKDRYHKYDFPINKYLYKTR